MNLDKFLSADVHYITDVHYYLDYNAFYEKVSFLTISFLFLDGKEQFNVKMRFNRVTSFSIYGFGDASNRLLGFRISDMKSDGFEKEMRYFVEDYEDDCIKFYCERYEMLSIEKINDEDPV